VKQALPKEAQAEFDEKAKEARTVADLSDIIQMLFAKYGETVPKSYMIFTYGRQEHVYVQMNPKMKRSLDKAMNYCRESGTDINDFFAPLLDAAAKAAAKELSKKSEAEAV
jgi:galactose-1-phosphate uridylyltransferase